MDYCKVTGKVRHKTRSSAQKTANRISAQDAKQGRRSGHMSVYRCEHCGSFHVGHTPKKNRYFPQHREGAS